MKKIVSFLVLFLTISVFSQSKSSLIKFKKDFNALEFKVKTKTDSLNFVVTKKINKISFDLKQELNDLENKYASNDLKLVIYKNKYEKEFHKIQAKHQILINEAQGEHQIELSKIQVHFITEKNKLQLKYNIGS